MNTHKRMIAVHDVLNRRFVYVDVDKILAVEDKPMIYVDGVNKQAKGAIVMDTVNESNNKIVIDETSVELFTRIAIGTGCIKLSLENISEMDLNNINISNDTENEMRCNIYD